MPPAVDAPLLSSLPLLLFISARVTMDEVIAGNAVSVTVNVRNTANRKSHVSFLIGLIVAPSVLPTLLLLRSKKTTS